MDKTNILVTIEALTGLMGLTTATGLMFAQKTRKIDLENKYFSTLDIWLKVGLSV